MPDSYETFKKEYLQLTGIDLNSYKENQMKRRIDNFITKHSDKTGYQNFLALLKSDTKVYKDFISYLTINVSEFYRNPAQWKTLETEIFPNLIKKFGKRLNIWSAACSTGDEPYSLAMVLSELVPLDQIQIQATDLDNEVLEKARVGYYSEKSVKGLPQKYQDKFIEPVSPGVVKVSDKLKSCINFKQQNLLKDSYPQGIHMIVCRNVMIYFTEEAKQEIYHKFASSLHKEGVLFVGSTEQIIGPSQYGLHSCQSFFYEKQ
ncbi:MAG: protein-glutamate O-methyltransferase CheR [Lachnospiraceae bacterium]|nr:protein-glutamate O-methyltransferase CheR [Lachnospiraceae bacterium]